MVCSTSLTMKDGEIAVVVGRVISLDPPPLVFYDCPGGGGRTYLAVPAAANPCQQRHAASPPFNDKISLTLRQESFHAEQAATGFFELRGINHDRCKTFLLKDAFKVRSDVRSEVASVGHDAVAHEFVGFLGGEFVNSFPVSAQGGERFGSVRPG